MTEILAIVLSFLGSLGKCALSLYIIGEEKEENQSFGSALQLLWVDLSSF